MSKQYFRPPSPASYETYKGLLHKKAEKSGYKDKRLTSIHRVAFILANAHFIFDWEKNCFAVANNSELRDSFIGEYKSNVTIYEKLLEGILSYAKTAIIGEDDLSTTKLLDQIRTYQPINPPAEDKGNIPNTYYAYSPLRNVGSNRNEDSEDLVANQIALNLRCVLIDEIARKVIFDHKLSGKDDLYQRLQPKLSHFDDAGFGYYLRDDCITLEEKIFQIDFGIVTQYIHLINHPEKNIHGINTPPHFLYKLTSNSDLLATELPVANSIPFALEGGNFIFCKNKDNKDILLMTISDLNYNYDTNLFIGSLVRDADGKIETCSSYEELKARMIEWGESQGYKVIMVERNLSEHEIASIYHLDTFCNVARLSSGENILVLPEADDNVITEASRAALIEEFGPSNIIEIDTQERSDFLCSNFIQFGNTVLLTHPDTPKRFIDALVNKGFSVVTPPIILERKPQEDLSDGIRCHTMPGPTCKSIGTSRAQEASRPQGLDL